MEKIPKNLIIDVIPAYLANDVSDETRRQVEAYAEQDADIAQLIETSEAPDIFDASTIAPDDALEFETIRRVKKSFRKKMIAVSMITVLILLLPLTAMNFTSEVDWDLLDFAVMGGMLLGAGLIYTVVSSLSDSAAYKVGVALAVLAGFLLIWINLAVGIIGPGENPVNLAYGLVFIVAGMMIWRSKFKAAGMATAMFITAVVNLLIPLLAFMTFRSGTETGAAAFLFSGLISFLLIIAGVFFKKAA